MCVCVGGGGEGGIQCKHFLLYSSKNDRCKGGIGEKFPIVVATSEKVC